MVRYSILLRTPSAFIMALATMLGGSGLTLAAQNLAAGLQPPMGWSSWSTFEDNVSATIIKAQALALHDHLQQYGYQYVNIDDGWHNGVDQYGRVTWDTKKFPDGISPVADYVHSLGLKFGIYLLPGIPAAAVSANSPINGTSYRISDIANTKLQGNTAKQGDAAIDYTKPGATAYVQSQVDLLATWGVDYIKMDFVGPGGGRVSADNRADIQHWHEAILNNGRAMHLELSNSLSFADVSTWANYSNGWRIEGDIECYCSVLTHFSRAATRFNDVPKWIPYAGPGHWNDLDSLEVGSGSATGMTTDERQTVVTLWSIESAPLLLGPDLTKLDAFDLTLLTNTEVIAVDQAGYPAKPLSQATNQQVWFADNKDGNYTVALFNLDAAAATVTVKWSQLGITGSVTARNLWNHTNLGTQPASYSVKLAAHASQLLQVTTS